jgi:hypothetical protein
VPGFELELAPIVTLRPKSGVRVRVRRMSDAPSSSAAMSA